MHRRTLIRVCVALTSAGVCPSRLARAQAPASGSSDPENTIYMDLKQGRVVIKLLPDVAPKHVARIKTLARQGFYDGTPFHRVIEGFMAQGGDPTGTGTGGSKLPNLPPEFSQRHFLRGVCGMARAAAARTAPTASSSSCSRRRPRWTASTHLGTGHPAAWTTSIRSSAAPARTDRWWVSRIASSICGSPRT